MGTISPLTIYAKPCVCVRACVCFFVAREYVAFFKTFKKINIETKGMPSIYVCLEAAMQSSRAELHQGVEGSVP